MLTLMLSSLSSLSVHLRTARYSHSSLEVVEEGRLQALPFVVVTEDNALDFAAEENPLSLVNEGTGSTRKRDYLVKKAGIRQKDLKWEARNKTALLCSNAKALIEWHWGIIVGDTEVTQAGQEEGSKGGHSMNAQTRSLQWTLGFHSPHWLNAESEGRFGSNFSARAVRELHFTKPDRSFIYQVCTNTNLIRLFYTTPWPPRTPTHDMAAKYTTDALITTLDIICDGLVATECVSAASSVTYVGNQVVWTSGGVKHGTGLLDKAMKYGIAMQYRTSVWTDVAAWVKHSCYEPPPNPHSSHGRRLLRSILRLRRSLLRLSSSHKSKHQQ
ncbi:hypothetical protein CPC08DRAFT_730416 [Agrocybe pediades]|nr:hypothetical protein CPC08DRAFT_730416 [Agrocybe pediades]